MNQSQATNLTAVLDAVTEYDLWQSRCSIYQPSEALNAAGQINLSTLTPVTGLQGLECMHAPLDLDTPYFGAETKARFAIEENKAFHDLLNGYFPGINPGMAAVIWPASGVEADGETLDIIVVEHDSQQIMSRMCVRRFSY